MISELEKLQVHKKKKEEQRISFIIAITIIQEYFVMLNKDVTNLDWCQSHNGDSSFTETE